MGVDEFTINITGAGSLEERLALRDALAQVAQDHRNIIVGFTLREPQVPAAVENIRVLSDPEATERLEQARVAQEEAEAREAETARNAADATARAEQARTEAAAAAAGVATESPEGP